MTELTHYKAELSHAYGAKTVEFKTDKTGVALVRLVKKELNCTGFAMTKVIESGDFTQWSSSDFCMTLQPLH